MHKPSDFGFVAFAVIACMFKNKITTLFLRTWWQRRWRLYDLSYATRFTAWASKLESWSLMVATSLTRLLWAFCGNIGRSASTRVNTQYPFRLTMAQWVIFHVDLVRWFCQLTWWKMWTAAMMKMTISEGVEEASKSMQLWNDDSWSLRVATSRTRSRSAFMRSSHHPTWQNCFAESGMGSVK